MATTSTPIVPEQYQATIDAAAQEWNVDPSVLAGLLQEESGFNPNAIAYATDGTPAEGIAQFQPATAAEYGVSPYNPTSAINGAAAYLHDLLGQFGGNYEQALTAYNEGPGAVATSGATTSDYAKSVLSNAQAIAQQSGESAWDQFLDLFGKSLDVTYDPTKDPTAVAQRPAIVKAAQQTVGGWQAFATGLAENAAVVVIALVFLLGGILWLAAPSIEQVAEKVPVPV